MPLCPTGAQPTRACTCASCRTRRSERQLRGNRVRRQRLADGTAPDLPHNASTYRNWGCRCDECRAANTEITARSRARARAARVA